MEKQAEILEAIAAGRLPPDQQSQVLPMDQRITSEPIA